nr:uncharacterized protein LOC103407285 [Malus domestica]
MGGLIFGSSFQICSVKTCWVEFNFLPLSPERKIRNLQLKTHSFVVPPWLSALLISRWFSLHTIPFRGIEIGALWWARSLTKLSREPINGLLAGGIRRLPVMIFRCSI